MGLNCAWLGAFKNFMVASIFSFLYGTVYFFLFWPIYIWLQCIIYLQFRLPIIYIKMRNKFLDFSEKNDWKNSRFACFVDCNHPLPSAWSQPWWVDCCMYSIGICDFGGNLWSALVDSRSTTSQVVDPDRVARSAFSLARSPRPWHDPSFSVAGASYISECTLEVFSLRTDSNETV